LPAILDRVKHVHHSSAFRKIYGDPTVKIHCVEILLEFMSSGAISSSGPTQAALLLRRTAASKSSEVR
jgi:hypothetical protein